MSGKKTRTEDEKSDQDAARFFASCDWQAGGDACWNWKRQIAVTGYGVISVSKRNVKAHRWAYESLVGPIPPGHIICHHCDNRLCVNPYHLFAGTHKQNTGDAVIKGRMVRGERQHAAKLSASDVLAIRELSRSGKRGNQIAKQYSVSPANISQILLRQTWRHLP